MGYHVGVSLYVGVKINASQRFKQVEVRGCNHVIQPNAKFCPQCGKPTYETDSVLVDGFTDGGDSYGDLLVEYAVNCDTDIMIVGRCVANVSDYDPLCLDLSTLQDEADKLKKALKGSPLLDLGPFGVWVCRYESY